MPISHKRYKPRPVPRRADMTPEELARRREADAKQHLRRKERGEAEERAAKRSFELQLAQGKVPTSRLRRQSTTELRAMLLTELLLHLEMHQSADELELADLVQSSATSYPWRGARLQEKIERTLTGHAAKLGTRYYHQPRDPGNA